jgi:intein-encoded DNA endonuclease-like protein
MPRIPKTVHPLYIKRLAKRLYNDGMSSRKVVAHLKEQLGVTIRSHRTILRWAKLQFNDREVAKRRNKLLRLNVCTFFALF